MGSRLIHDDEGRVLEHQYEEISRFSIARKLLKLEPGDFPLERSKLCLFVAEYDGNTLPLEIFINGTRYELHSGETKRLFHWRQLEVDPADWIPGLNVVELRSSELAHCTWMMAVENRPGPLRSQKSFDEGVSWQDGRLGVNYTVQGEYLIRLLVEGPSIPKERDYPQLVFQSLNHPALARFSQSEQLHEITKAAEGDYGKAVLLCSWAGKQWRYTYGTVYTPFFLPTLLHWRRNERGHGSGSVRGYCVHYAHLLIQACWAIGIQARGIALPPYDKTKGSGHFVMEAFCRDQDKWVMFDANYDLHLRKDGVPLHTAEWMALRNRGDSNRIEVVRGTSFGFNDKFDFFLDHLHTARYENFAVPLRSDLLDRPDLYLVHHGAIPAVDYHETQFIYYDVSGTLEERFPYATKDANRLYAAPHVAIRSE
ncbi:transglutaminase family protein [Paenibacillus solisilvae]|uniref:Transglutaminase family protein n=1 Tax=Paenibacillus solisilvae TaxID=2486751 RepID=A0ABW0VXI3_9BACL